MKNPLERSIKLIAAEYSEHGYTILVNGVETYSAGNNRQDSQQQAAPGEEMPLKEIKACAIKTGKEMAAQCQGKWMGEDRVRPESCLSSNGSLLLQTLACPPYHYALTPLHV